MLFQRYTSWMLALYLYKTDCKYFYLHAILADYFEFTTTVKLSVCMIFILLSSLAFLFSTSMNLILTTESSSAAVNKILWSLKIIYIVESVRVNICMYG